MLHDSRSDQQLIDAANAGSAEAFQALYLRYRDWCLRVALRITRDPDDALDVLQETWLYVLRKFPGFQLSSRMTTLLYPAIKNTALGVLNRHRRDRVRAAERPQAVDAAAPDEPDAFARSDLAILLSKLPEGQAEVLLLRFVDDLSLEAIAEALHIPIGTVKSRLHNALAALRADPRFRNFFDAM